MVISSTSNRLPAKTASAERKPMVESKAAPIKKPAPLSEFFDPVKIATHLNSLFSACFDSPFC